MTIDKTSFFAALASLVAGGAGGYYAGEHGMLKAAVPSGVTEPQAPLSPPSTGATAATAPAAPVCDDSLGSPAACPAPGYPSEEGGCGAMPTKRCEDFKRSMKPRVAARAVDCLNALTPAQRCDPNRVSLCAHEALMNACPEPEGAVVAAARPVDDVTARCDSIAQGCGTAGLGPSPRECRSTLAGLSAFGRDQMASCMRAHCADKGLVGCEAVIDAK
jgi:hypothetical protein